MKRFERFQKVKIKDSGKEGRVIAKEGDKYLVKVDGEKKLIKGNNILDEEFLKDIFHIKV